MCGINYKQIACMILGNEVLKFQGFTMFLPAGGAKVQNVSVLLLIGHFSFPSAVKKEPGESLTRAVLLVDPPLNNKPIVWNTHTYTHR